MNTLKDQLQETIKDKFGIDIYEWKDIDRPFQYRIITAIVKDKAGEIFFLKESKEYTSASDLDKIYTAFEDLRNRRPRLVCLPLSYGIGQYGITIQNKTFHLFNFIELKDLDKNLISFKKLQLVISELHTAIGEKELPVAENNQFKSLENWLERPVIYLPERYGSNLPYVDNYKNFLLTKFKSISLQNGNLHWDISPENVCMDNGDSVFFIDLEMAHKGPILFDYIRAASIYLEYHDHKVSISDDIFNELESLASDLSSGMDTESLRFLLSRCVVRNIRGGLMPSSPEEIKPFLVALENFVLATPPQKLSL